MLWLVVALLVLAVLAAWVTWTAHRIERLYARVGTAQAALDAQLVRRAASARAIADADGGVLGRPATDALRTAALAALAADEAGREAAENDLGRALAGVRAADASRLAELEEATTRVSIARLFHNDAVRDLHELRAQRMPRHLRLGARRPLPGFFQIDDRY